MKTFLLSILVFTQLTASAQVLTKFSWDGPGADRLKADQGPSAVSAGSTATVALVNITNGVSNYALSPGAASNDINLTLPNSTYFDVPALDFSIDFRREESDANFLTRSSIFEFGMSGGKLFVKFSLLNPNGTINAISSGSIYNIPDDHKFHNYRFVYDNMTGIANVWADGVSVYSYTGKGNWPMSWKNAGAPVIGRLMDATGRNVGVIDNVEMRAYSMALVLPVNFLSFQASANAGNSVTLAWSTNNEYDVRNFNVEKSTDGISFKTIARVASVSSNSHSNRYTTSDQAGTGVFYYRIAAVSYDGKTDYTEIKKVANNMQMNTKSISAFPNPAAQQVTINLPQATTGSYSYKVVTQDGRSVQTGSKDLQQSVAGFTIQFQTAVPRNAMLTIIVTNNESKIQETVRVFRS